MTGDTFLCAVNGRKRRRFVVVQTKTPTQAAKSGPLEWGTLIKIIELNGGLPGPPAHPHIVSSCN